MKTRRTLHLTASVLVAAAAVAIFDAQDERRTPASAGVSLALAPNGPPSAVSSVRPERRSSNRPSSAPLQSPERSRLAERSAAQPSAANQAARSTPLWQQWHRQHASLQGTIATAANAAIHHPAVWVDLGDQSMLTISQQADLQEAAESLQQRIAEPNLPLDSADYRARWQAEVEESDVLFRQRYGGYAWHRHHIQAFHLGSGTPASAR